MKYGSVCSGIEAATVAWESLGWTPAFFSEIDAFPRAILQHRFPEVPLHGDFTTIQVGDYEPIDLLVGGTPCQSFSVAGLRAGLADDRGNLALQFLALAGRLRPKWVVWENVPGVFSSLSHDAPDPRPPPDPMDVESEQEAVVEDEYDADESHAFGCFLAGLSELGYGWAYRTLDAQFFGVAQRRRRVFVVGYLGDWRRAAAVLFERHSLSGHPPPRREAGQRIASTIEASLGRRSGTPNDHDPAGGLIAGAHGTLAFGGNDTSGPIEVATARNAHGGPHGRLDFESETFVAHALRADGFDASEDGTGRGTPIVPVHAFDARQSDVIQYGDQAGPLDTDAFSQAICFSAKDHGADAETDLSPTLRAGGHAQSHANAGVMPAVAFDPTQITSKANRSNPKAGDPVHTLAKGQHAPAIAFALRGREDGAQPEMSGDATNALRSASGGSSRDYVAGTVRSHTRPGSNEVGSIVPAPMAVRRLTPTECERLQGFPDGWTAITYRGKPAADGPRYKAIGNSMAVPVMAWIGRRIQMVNEIA